MTQQRDLTLGLSSHGLFSNLHPQAEPAFDSAAWLTEHLPQRPGGTAGRELDSLARERDPELFGQGLLSLASRQANHGNFQLAAQLYNALGQGGETLPAEIRRQALRRFEALQGRGEVGDVAEVMIGRFAEEATEPTSLLAMGVAGAAFKMTRLATLGRLAATPSANFLTRGFGARALASVAGFGVEATVFPLAGRVFSAGAGRPQDWSREALGRDLASSFLFLGAMKMSGWAAGAGFNRIHGINPLSGQATHLSGISAISRPLVPQLGMLGGILIGHELEVATGLREAQPFTVSLVHSLAMLAQFNVAGRATRTLFGERFHSWENQLEMQTQALSQRALARPHSPTLNFGPELSFAGAGTAAVGPRGSESISELAARPLRMQSLGGEGGGSREGSGGGRRIDPEQSLAMLPMGAVTPHGNERTTHQKAVGDPAWVAEVAAMNGHLEYRGDGVYADKQSGEILSPEQILSRYGDVARAETGFRELTTTLPLETPWGGQIPSGLRGQDGEIEGRLLQVMGLTKSGIRQLRFNQSSTLIARADQFALQGLYALYRSAVRWGIPLGDIVGHNPEALGLSAAPGLGGVNHLVKQFLASAERAAPGSTKTRPPTGPMWLPSTLADSMQGVLVAVLGPKYEGSSIGNIPVDVGACATGYKAFAQAADMFRPQWPGAVPTELAIFGSSEAPHGLPHARPSVTGFNAMGAMETLEQLGKRMGLSSADTQQILASLEGQYAPMTTAVNGFWKSEGAGMGGLIRLGRAIEHGLPVSSVVAGYAVRGDQGGKKNPADIGYGGRNALRTALRMAQEWQDLSAAQLDYFSGHLTGTGTNNAAEAALLAEVLPAETRMRLTALKAFLGHGLGAAGSMELALVHASIENQVGPGAFNLQGRTLAADFQALAPRVEVSSDLVRNIRMAGGQSQGFAGNNAAALFRAIDDQVLHEVYGYSMPEIAAYRSRLSEREAVSRQWEEDVRTGRRTIGEFLSWFGLGDTPPPAKPTTVVMPGEGGESEISPAASSVPAPFSESSRPPLSAGSESFPPTSPELARMMSSYLYDQKAPAVLRGLRVNPSQVVVSLGRGQMLTTRGTARATRSAAMRGIDHPLTLAYLSEDFGLTRYNGRDELRRETWVRADTGEAVTPAQIAQDFGERLLRESGIRDIPLESRPAWVDQALKIVQDSAGSLDPDQLASIRTALLSQAGADRLPVRHGGLIPEPLRGSAQIMARMGLVNSRLQGTAFANQRRNLEWASDMGAYGLFAALSAQTAFGRPFQELFHSTRYGAVQGSAFPGMDRLAQILDMARTGKDSVTYSLQSALAENPRGLYLNLMMPHFDFSELRENPQALDRIVPPGLGRDQMPNTGGVNLACSAACASGLYALFAGRGATIRTGLAGEYPMDAFMLLGADATFSPFASSPLVAGFSRKAPMTVDAMVHKLVDQGLIPESVRSLKEVDRIQYFYNEVPEALRRRAMNESSAPFTRHAQGLVVAEGAAGLPWMNFQRAIESGIWPSARLLGIHVNSGEGGAANLASMDQGVVTATKVALAQAEAHGAIPRLWQAHGTSTGLNNIAEVMSIHQALRSAGMSEPMAVSAIKGLVGHTMGAASAIDLVMGVQSLLDGEAPGLFNFRPQDLDPRYSEKAPGALDQFRFSSEPSRDFDSLLITSEGFLSADGAAVLGRFPQHVSEAKEMLRDYGVPEHQRNEWAARAADNRARAEEMEESLRRSGNYLASMEALRYRP